MPPATVTSGDPAITACILAGGRAMRLGGVDKGLVRLAGRPLIEHCIVRLRAHVGAIVINANRNLEVYGSYGFTTCTDLVGDFAGPLAGIASSLRVATSPYIVTVACDTPFFPPDLVQRLIEPVRERGYALSVARSCGRIQPVFTCIPTGLVNSLESYLRAGGRRVEPWLRLHQLAEVDFGQNADAFLNINTLHELESAQSSHPQLDDEPATSGADRS